jgi:hypothetical protein
MKAAGAFNGLSRVLRHNMRAIYCENWNGATLQTLASGPSKDSYPRQHGR